MNKDSPRKTLNRTYLIILQLSFPCHLMGFYSTREDGAQREHLVRKHWSIKIERAFLFPLKWDKNKFNLLYEVFVHMKSNIQRMFLKINFFSPLHFTSWLWEEVHQSLQLDIMEVDSSEGQKPWVWRLTKICLNVSWSTARGLRAPMPSQHPSFEAG